MANATNGNVRALGDHPRARARLTPQESAGVLKDCRELALDRIAASLAGMLDRVEDDLFQLAEKATERDAQNVYLDARAQARDKRPVIEAAFRRYFVEFFNRTVRGENLSSFTAPAPGELRLVDDEALEESIAVSEMARKLKSACEGELFALNERMGFLLERPELQDEANPISPATICAALKDACDQIEAGIKVRLTLLRQFEQHVGADLQRVYHDLNSHLVQRQILPEIRPVVRRAANAPEAARRPAPGAEPGAPTDVFRTLAQFLGQAAQAGVVPGAPGTLALPPAGVVPQAFVSELTRMQGAPMPAVPGADEALVNVLRGLRAAPGSSQLSAVDAMTVDIVAMLFDYVFDDRQIPASVKSVLSRLQIPTLKVALLDKGFFSSKSHPARRLLDRLAELAIGLDDTSVNGGAAFTLIDRVVNRVGAEFDTDFAIFETLVAEVEAFLAAREREEAEIVERSARWIEERERTEIARLTAEDEVARRLAARAWVPAPLRAMLGETWVRALAAVHRAEGESAPAWTSLLATMEDLLWSVEPKASAEDRKRLVTMLPGMLRSLHEGLVRGEIEEAKREAFLGALVDCHAAAVKAGLRGLAVVPEAPPPAPEPEPSAPAIERELLSQGDLKVEEIRLRTPRGRGSTRNVFTRTGIWTNLKRGTWVEFARPGASALRARLTWISPAKGVYLFTNPACAANAVSISPEALAEQMRQGEARIIDGAPLVDRAVDSMIENLREGARA